MGQGGALLLLLLLLLLEAGQAEEEAQDGFQVAIPDLCVSEKGGGALVRSPGGFGLGGGAAYLQQTDPGC